MSEGYEDFNGCMAREKLLEEVDAMNVTWSPEIAEALADEPEEATP